MRTKQSQWQEMFAFSMSFAEYFLFRIKRRLNMSVKLKFDVEVNAFPTTDLPDHLSIDKQTTEKVCEFWFYLKEIKFKFSDRRATLNYKQTISLLKYRRP